MSKDINEVHLKGRAGKDAEVRFTSSGKSITKFSLATGGGKSKDGSKEYPTEWHNIEIWENEAAGSIRKGDEVELWGRIKYESWDDRQTGQKKYMTKIVATKIAPLDGAEPPTSDRHDFANQPPTSDRPDFDDVPF